MANANINLIQLANTFNDWRIAFNNIANSVNELRNGNPYYKDNGNFIIANGALLITSTSGTGLSVTNNVLFSALATLNTSIQTGLASYLDNVTMTGANSWLSFANTVTGPVVVANTTFYGNGVIVISGKNVSNSPFVNTISGNAVVNVANNILASNTGNIEAKGNLYLSNANSSLNVAGNVFVGNNVSVGNTLTANNLKIGSSAEIDTLYLDPTHTYQVVNGNAIFNNLTIEGTQSIVGTTVNSTDTIVLRANVATAGDGKIVVAQGTTNGNAVIEFSQSDQVWKVTANANAVGAFLTLLTTANLIDNFTSTSTINAPTSNALNSTYSTATAAYAQANAAYAKANSALSSGATITNATLAA